MASLPVWSIKNLIEAWKGRLDNDFDCIVIVDGGTGQGKSTLVNKALLRMKGFKPWKDQLYARDEVLDQIAQKQKGIIWADELVNIAHNRNFYEPDQILLVKRLNMYRDHNNLYIGCVPEFQSVDPQLLRLAHMRITIVRRGVALIQMPMRSLYSKDPWDMKNNSKIEAKWALKGTKNPRYARLTTARGLLFFEDMTEMQRKLYKEIKRVKREKIYGELANLENQKDPEKIFYSNLIDEMRSGKVNKDNFAIICKIAGKKYRSTQIRINEILRERGENERFRDLINSNNNMVKKDDLGFKIPKKNG